MFDLSTITVNPFFWFSGIRVNRAAKMMQSQSIRTQQVEAFHRAFHQVYSDFAVKHPVWVTRGFNQELLRRTIMSAGKSDVPSKLPSGYALAAEWDRQFGLLISGARRVQLTAELVAVADSFLQEFATELMRMSENW